LESHGSAGPRGDPVPERAGFRFVACVELQEALGLEAHDAQGLAELLEEAAAESVVCHTRMVLLRGALRWGQDQSDFADWARHDLGDPARAGMGAIRARLRRRLDQARGHALRVDRARRRSVVSLR
jgi:hypothetical protein